MLLRVSFETLASCFALLLIASELIYLALTSPALKLQAVSRPPQLHLFVVFVPVVVLSRQRADGSFHPFVVRKFCYLLWTEYQGICVVFAAWVKFFGSLIVKVNIYFSIILL